jgi:basic membrane protein A
MLKNLVACGSAARRAACLTVAASLFLPVFSLAQTATPGTAAPGAPLKIGFVHVAPVTDAGWVHQHELGRRALEAALGARVLSTVVENVPEGADAERVIRDLAANGHGLIFTPSFGYMEPTLKVAREFPQVKFESITGYKTAPNVAAANARYYEGRYLAGIAAGRASRSGVAGYLAGFPIPEVLQGINAFALGMRSVNPQAQVRLVWLNSWFDPPRERDAAITLFNQGVDVIAFHTASTAVMAAAQERGKLAIAYHSDMRKTAPDAQLLAVTHRWGGYYTERARAVLDGTWKSGQVWGGIGQDMVRVEAFGPKAGKALQDEVLARQKDIAAGRLFPFAAGKQAVHDNSGKIAIGAGKRLDDEQIQAMNWLVQGVLGVVPK